MIDETENKGITQPAPAAPVIAAQATASPKGGGGSEAYPPIETSEAFPDGYQYHAPEEVNGNG